MRIALLGPPGRRARLRARLPASIEVVAEYLTLSEARSAGLDVDALLLAPEFEEAADPRTASAEGPRAARRTDAAWADTGLEPHDAAVEALTGREMEVLNLMAQGLPNKGIAARLGISDQTVKFHVASISGKLGAANRTDAVRRAVRRGLLTL